MKSLKVVSNIKLNEQFVEKIVDGINGAYSEVTPRDLSGKARQDAELTEKIVTKIVEHLRDDFPNHNINKLMGRVWEILNQKKVMLGQGPAVQSISFALLPGNPDRAVVFLPLDFLDKYQKDPVFITGGMVCIGVQMRAYVDGVDFFDVGIQKIQDLSEAFETEYLLTEQKTNPNFKPDEYQKVIMQKYPTGLVSLINVVTQEENAND